LTVPIVSLSSGGGTTTSANDKSGSSFLSNAAQLQHTNSSITVTEDTRKTRKRKKYVLGNGYIINADEDKENKYNTINTLQLQRNNSKASPVANSELLRYKRPRTLSRDKLSLLFSIRQQSNDIEIDNKFEMNDSSLHKSERLKMQTTLSSDEIDYDKEIYYGNEVDYDNDCRKEFVKKSKLRLNSLNNFESKPSLVPPPKPATSKPSDDIINQNDVPFVSSSVVAAFDNDRSLFFDDLIQVFQIYIAFLIILNIY